MAAVAGAPSPVKDALVVVPVPVPAPAMVDIMPTELTWQHTPMRLPIKETIRRDRVRRGKYEHNVAIHLQYPANPEITGVGDDDVSLGGDNCNSLGTVERGSGCGDPVLIESPRTCHPRYGGDYARGRDLGLRRERGANHTIDTSK